MTLEREVKLDVPQGFEMPDLGSVDTRVAIADAGISTYETVWFDTPDVRLARWGASLRFRDGEGWTLKLGPSSNGDLLTREELRFEGDGDTVPEAAARLVRGFARGAPLDPRVRATTTRRRIELSSSDRPLVELVDDAVEITQAPVGASRFRQIELELRSDDGGPLAREVASAIRAAGAIDGAGAPKLEHALGGRPAPEFDVPVVDGDSTVGRLVRGAIAGPVRSLIEHDPGVRLGRDPEDVHKARVATRRLRSNLRTFLEWLEPQWANELRAELRWIADDLGAVRDADVMYERLRRRVQALDDVDGPAAMELVDRLGAARAEGRQRLLSSMSSPRYDVLLDRLVAAAREPALRGATDAPAQAAGRVLEARWSRLRRTAERLDGSSRPDALHRLRIRAKRVRYAAEAVRPVFGGRAKTFVAHAVALQDLLGEHHDAVVLEAWLREAGSRARGTRAFVAGELAALEHRTAEAAAGAWPHAWRSLARKRNVFWA